MDGNFSLAVMKRKGGSSSTPFFQNSIFLNQEDVEPLLKRIGVEEKEKSDHHKQTHLTVRTSTKLQLSFVFQLTDIMTKGCENRFKAGGLLTKGTSRKFENLQISGCFAAVCSHMLVERAVYMKDSGEKYA